MTFADLAPVTLLAVAALMAALWTTSLVLRDASIVDIFWGFGFAMIALVGYVRADGVPARRTLVTALTVIWGMRLALHLLIRNAGAGEDHRYQAMRRRWGTRFPVVSLVSVFGLQGLLMWIVSLPVQAAQTSSAPDVLTWVDALGILLWTIGFAFEVVGDSQLTRFKADPDNQGRVMEEGLWKYTRHPNYFGDATLWWGLGAIGLAARGWWALVGPLVMTVLLLRVSGVPLLERRLKTTRSGYADYVRRTSTFLPMPPKR